MSDRKAQPWVRCYGVANGRIEAALQKVAAAGVLGSSHVLLVIDDGNIETLHASFSGVLSDLHRIAGQTRVLLYNWARKDARLRESAFVRKLTRWPLSLEEIRNAEPVVADSAVVCGMSDLVAYLGGLADQYRTQRTVHGKAVREIWEANKFHLPDRKGMFPVKVVLVDDDPDFRKKAEGSLGNAVDLEVYPSLNEYLSDVESSKATPPESVALFLLDIVSEKKGTLSLPGMERALPALNRARGLKQQPLIFMLSTLPRKMIGHICLRMRADYYLEKREFNADQAPGETLWNLMVSIAHADAWMSTCNDESKWDKWRGWKKLLDDAQIQSEECLSQLRVDLALLWQLFSRSMKVERIDLIKSFADGKSGARVLAVSVKTINHNHPIAPRIVKCAPHAKLVQEWTAFHENIATVMTGSFGRVEPCYAVKSERAALSMTIAGTTSDFSMDRIVGCNEIFERDAAHAAFIPKRIFSTLLLPLHGMDCGRDLPMSAVLDFMASELLPVRVGAFETGDTNVEIVKVKRDPDLCEVCFQEVREKKLGFPLLNYGGDDLKKQGTLWHVRPGTRCKIKLQHPAGLIVKPSEAIKRSLENAQRNLEKDQSNGKDEKQKAFDSIEPALKVLVKRLVLDLDQRIITFTTKLKERSSLCVNYGVVHGDLNLKNILTSEVSEGLWLIDFANTRPGLPALDFVTFEVELRLQLIVPRIAEIFNGKCLMPDKWMDDVWNCAGRFETLVQDDERVDVKAMCAEITDGNNQVIKRAWQGVLGTREQAFRMHYPDTKGRAVYDAVFVLFLLRVLQKYEAELFSPLGPVGIVWAAAAMDVCLKNAGI